VYTYPTRIGLDAKLIAENYFQDTLCHDTKGFSGLSLVENNNPETQLLVRLFMECKYPFAHRQFSKIEYNENNLVPTMGEK